MHASCSMQESFLLNLGCGDQDSLGLFQQRPIFAWGTESQIQDPVLSARAFYGVADHTSNPGLVNIAGWEDMAVGEAAQAVQVCIYHSNVRSGTMHACAHHLSRERNELYFELQYLSYITLISTRSALRRSTRWLTSVFE